MTTILIATTALVIAFVQMYRGGDFRTFFAVVGVALTLALLIVYGNHILDGQARIEKMECLK